MLCANVTLEPGLRDSSCENDNPAGKTQADTPTAAQITHNPELDRAPTGGSGHRRLAAWRFRRQCANDYGLTFGYDAMIRDIFVDRFTAGNTQDVCLDADGVALGTEAAGECALDVVFGATFAYTLLEWNFPTFFGLAVQAYEATLFTERTIIDLINGGVAEGVVSNGLPGRRLRTVEVGFLDTNAATGAPLPGLSLEACIAALTNGVRAADRQAGVNACYAHYAKFIHPEPPPDRRC